MTLQIKTKKQFVDMAMLGVIPFTPKIWPCLGAFSMDTNTPDFAAVLNIEEWAEEENIFWSEWMYYRVPKYELLPRLRNKLPGSYVIHEPVPKYLDSGHGLQGILHKKKSGILLEFSEYIGMTRHHLSKYGRNAFGDTAFAVMELTMQPCDYINFKKIYDLCKNNSKTIIEFTYYAQPWGMYNNKLIIWNIKTIA